MNNLAEKICESAEKGKVKNRMVLVIAGLLFLVSAIFLALAPGALSNAIDKATTGAIQTQLEPINAKLEQNSERISNLEKMQNSQIISAGIAGYKTFECVPLNQLPEKLEESPMSAAGIVTALKVKSIREILYQLNKERTEYYLNYFHIE